MDKSTHTFHIPVMGTGFSIDTPIKVAKYGISSVISLVDDALIEEMRRYYSHLMGETYVPITKHDEDHRARRITEYLNLVDRIVKKQFEELKNSAFEIGSEITKYFRLLPDQSPLKKLYQQMLATVNPEEKQALQQKLRESIVPGDINVNIMTKLDRVNFAKDGSELPPEYSDALAALRGYAKSTLESAIVFSAGFNRRLYSYAEEFKDFYADATGRIKKRIVIKVSDYRSALTQGKFFAKKGIWVSEYRVESGLNCGGHAFATDGYLMGPILEEFRRQKDQLVTCLHEMCNAALQLKNKIMAAKPHEVRITAQGGIGNNREQNFLMRHYALDATGWGTPFLLCPEVTNVDPDTLDKLAAAGEDDVYLSEVSPLGVPFNNLRTCASDEERNRRVEKGRPGSACPKGFLVSNTEFTAKPICTASRQYQKLKLEQLEQLNLDIPEQKAQWQKIIIKSCICHDLGASVTIKYNLEQRPNPAIKQFPAICPGPNLAYFSKITTLEEMADHIYGRLNILNSTPRPHMFLKELKMYIDYFVKEAGKALQHPSEKQRLYLLEFHKNLIDGIEYYKELFPQILEETAEFRQKMLAELQEFRKQLELFMEQNHHFFSVTPQPVVS